MVYKLNEPKTFPDFISEKWSYDNYGGEDYLPLEETRILLGHSPCYDRAGYMMRDLNKEPMIDFNMIDENQSILENSERVAESFESNLDGFMDTIKANLFEDKDTFLNNMKTEFKHLMRTEDD